MKKIGIISLGEAFVDYISINSTNTEYQQLLGGATVNLAVGARRFGIPVYYLCKLGTDEISQFVEQEFKKEGINTEFSVRISAKRICGVYIHNEDGERVFHSYINPTPDEVLTRDELRKAVFDQAKIFYFGSGTLFHKKAKETTETAINFAREASNMIAFDANLRLKRWENEEHCRQTVTSFLKKADIVKLAEDELAILMETDSIEAGLEKISEWKIPYLFVTMGSKGAIAIAGGKQVFVPAPNVNAIDTNGAGDAFMSGLLYCFHQKGVPAHLSAITEYLQFANQIGALATTQIGSLTALLEIEKL